VAGNVRAANVFQHATQTKNARFVAWVELIIFYSYSIVLFLIGGAAFLVKLAWVAVMLFDKTEAPAKTLLMVLLLLNQVLIGRPMWPSSHFRFAQLCVIAAVHSGRVRTFVGNVAGVFRRGDLSRNHRRLKCPCRWGVRQ